jgi:hypothetical protein
MGHYRFVTPPPALQHAVFDNIVLFPASALPYKPLYQQIANRLPAGSVLIVTSKRDSALLHAARATARVLRSNGHLVALHCQVGHRPVPPR